MAFDALPTRESRSVQRRWREIYRPDGRLGSRRFAEGDLEWHVFSYGAYPAKKGATAEALYAAQNPLAFYVWYEGVGVYDCRGDRLPLFSGSDHDVHVFPKDFAWTAAFTHEESGMGLGPYFARRTE